MYIYILILVLALAGAFLLKQGSTKSTVFLVCWLATLALFVGFSDMLGGYDRYIYGELFDEVADVRRAGGEIQSAYIFELYSSEFGFSWLNVAISYITANRYIFILILTIVIYSLLFISFKKYVDNYPFALVLFMGLIFFFTFTYLRQLVGVGVGWLSIEYVYKRKLWKFLAIVLLATLIHNSAIILLSIYFLPIKQYSKKLVIVLMVFCFIVGITGIPSAVFDIYGSVSEMEGRGQNYAQNEVGFKIEYILEAFFFLYFILRNYEKVPKTPTKIVLLNMALLFCAVLLIFSRSLNGGRLGWYYLIGLISTLSLVVPNGKRIGGQFLVLSIFSCFLFLRILLFAWGPLGTLYPYKSFFTNGVRKGDWVHDKWEYDQDYDRDKFYR
ncbi:EpsG family protein [Hoylesella loescheii]|jgi:putative capsular polysaccharide biosynthesis protein|uniref:EpsG family protein n=1 Tax=Hoylesella loescheii TaxID=840 RepID=UPI0028E77DF2|nr:EpsG family protein [Hoylesella loescheii]